MRIMLSMTSLCLIIFVSACNVLSSTQTLINDRANISTPTPMKTVTQQEYTPPTKVVPTTILIASSTPQPSAIATTNLAIDQRCISMDETLPLDFMFLGDIAFETHDPQTKYPLSFLNLKTGEFSTIQKTTVTTLVLSPDGKRYAYEDYEKRIVYIFSNAHEPILSLPIQQEEWAFRGWIDAERIYAVVYEPEGDSNPLHVKYPPAIAVINLFEDQIQILPSDYPQIDKASHNFRWGRWGITVYDPTATKVVYPGDAGTSAGYILYDTVQKKILAQIPNDFWIDNIPQWSPDGSKFVMVGENEFYLVTLDGRITKISHINPFYEKTTTIRGLDYSPHFYTWSPDGKLIAMWLRETDTRRETLAILNPRTGRVTDTCIRSGFDPNYLTASPYPIWSPNGRGIVVPANYNSGTKGYDVVLIDLEKQKGYKIASNQFPVGWLASP